MKFKLNTDIATWVQTDDSVIYWEAICGQSVLCHEQQALFLSTRFIFFKLHGIQNREMLNAVQGWVITFFLV